MFTTRAMIGLATLALGLATLATPAAAQAVIHPVVHYSGEDVHSNLWRQHYRFYSREDRMHDDSDVAQFEQPIGEGVR